MKLALTAFAFWISTAAIAAPSVPQASEQFSGVVTRATPGSIAIREQDGQEREFIVDANAATAKPGDTVTIDAQGEHALKIKRGRVRQRAGKVAPHGAPGQVDDRGFYPA